MRDEQIARIADAVADRLANIEKLADAPAEKLNGQYSGIREDMEAGF